MKYSVGDIVKIRTWKDMKKKYGLSHGITRCISVVDKISFMNSMEEEINEKFPDRILTIKGIDIEYNHNYYKMKEMDCKWQDWMIEIPIFIIPIPIPIVSRYEILDL